MFGTVWIGHLVHVVFSLSKTDCFPISQGSSGHSFMSAPLAELLANMFRNPGNCRAMHNSVACSHILVRHRLILQIDSAIDFDPR